MNRFLKYISVLSIFLSIKLFALATSGVNNFSGFSTDGDSIKSDDFILSANYDSNNTSLGVILDGDVAYPGTFSGTNEDKSCRLVLQTDGTNTFSFELTDIELEEYAGNGSNNLSLIGSTVAGGEVTSTNTLGDDAELETFSGSDFGLSNFDGVQITKLTVSYKNDSDGACDGLTFNSFTISNASDTAPSNNNPTISVSDKSYTQGDGAVVIDSNASASDSDW